ncbi:hypothetical protein AAZX31_11G217500 [Glycine max]
MPKGFIIFCNPPWKKDDINAFNAVLVEFESETLLKEVVRAHGTIKTKVGRFFSSSNPLRLDKVAADRQKFVHRREMTHSYVTDSDVTGREQDKGEIIKLLNQQDPNDDCNSLYVIPIVGMEGLGKSTLAKFVFNDKRIHECFPLKMWVCVSEDFHIKQLVIKIINSDSAFLADAPDPQLNFNILYIEQLQKQLRNKLAEGLSLEDSLSHLVKWAFKEKEEEEKYPHLVNIGKEIVKKCRGIPFPVRTLGSLLFSKFEANEWEYVRNNEVWNFPPEKMTFYQHLNFVNYGISYLFKIHDLVHDLPLYLVKVKCLLVNFHIQSIPENVQHLSFVEEDLHGKSFTAKSILDLSDSTFETLPRFIGKLKHLRYLNLCNNKKIKRLPNSICKLQNLQILSLRGSMELEALSKGLKSLISLYNFGITTKQASLPLDSKHFPALEYLRVDNCDKLELSNGHEDQNFNLRLKTIMFYSSPQLVNLPHWLQGSVNTLVSLMLDNCDNLEVLPDWLPKLTCLKVRYIADCPKLQSLPYGIHCVSALERLEIADCPELCRKYKP